MGSQHRVRSMLRLPIFSGDEKSQNTLLDVFKKWAGDFEIRFTKDRMTYWVETPLEDDLGITQYTSLHFDPLLHPRGGGINNAPGEEQFLALLAFGLACSNEDEELPKKLHEYFLPQKLLVDLSETELFSLTGTKLISTPVEVGFDEVTQWWDETKLKSVNLPQVIIGKSKNSPLPVLDPGILAKILSGVAEVYFTSTPSVMDAMNAEVGADQIPSGSIRIIGASESNPSVVYTPSRIKEVEAKFGRSVILDIFLRLSLNGLLKNDIPFNEWGMLNQPVPELAPHNIQSLDDFEAIENLNYLVDFKESQIQELQHLIDSLEIDKKKQENKLFQFEQNSETIISRMQELSIQNEENLRMKKELKKELKKERRRSKEILPLLDEIVDTHGLESMSELTKLIRSEILEIEEKEIEVFEEYNPATLVEVLQRAKSECHNKIIILDSAFKSARQSTFRPPIRVWEIIQALIEKYEHVLQRTNQKQSINLQSILRENTATGTLDIANKESKSTMKSFGEQRVFRYENRNIEIQTHIKIGTQHDQSKTLRLYFTFDKSTKKFIIGHCGKHLDTVSSN
ncbi:hypothetical protein [Candidatus Poseidonia alphae]|uniref:hypothetical protein n=1 Tax=Candidatus Poseidonia alphae TaxID=1915863 RepID=UPI0030C773AB